MCRLNPTSSDDSLAPLLLPIPLRNGFSTWRRSLSTLSFAWGTLARFVVFSGQLRFTLDTLMLDRRGSFALGALNSLHSAKHCVGGAITRFALVITPHRVHYTFGHVRRCAGHIKWSIARRHRDPHACARSPAQNRHYN